MDDVIQLNNVYTSLNENLSSINKTNNWIFLDKDYNSIFINYFLKYI
jgi:hypothetical protein